METGRRAYGLDVRLSPLAARFARHDLSGHRFQTVIALGLPSVFMARSSPERNDPSPSSSDWDRFLPPGQLGNSGDS
jgi:hypothetical protein